MSNTLSHLISNKLARFQNLLQILKATRFALLFRFWFSSLSILSYIGTDTLELSSDFEDFAQSVAQICMTILGMDSLLGRYIHFVKRNFKPILTKEAEKVISSYYQLQRRSATQNAARTTVRMLESLIRLAQVHARLMFRNEVTRSDAITAILCIESSMTASAIVDSVGNALHSNFTHLWVPVRMEKESPSTMLWTLFYLVQHYDRRGQYDIALAKIDEAIEHTPTVIDLYSVKGRILKHAGDLVAAAALADEVRCMDLADRYVNSECVKRMLEADQVSLAEKTAVLFTKDGDQHKNLHDMQCMWYELASGESYFRQGDLGRALKKFLFVEKHYADINEDQSDFHSYCLRKMTLRTYVEMLKFQDRLHSHDYFCKAAAGAIR